MAWQRLEKATLVILCAAFSAMILGLLRLGTSEGAQESITNCSEVMLEDRCACNERIPLAFTQGTQRVKRNHRTREGL